MKVKSSLKLRTQGREEIRARRKGKRMILDKADSNKGGRLKVRTPIPKAKKRLIKKKRKY